MNIRENHGEMSSISRKILGKIREFCPEIAVAALLRYLLRILSFIVLPSKLCIIVDLHFHGHEIKIANSVVIYLILLF